ncbi:MAG TPA: phosphotransferase [Candidatus Limnocylindria bacterium]|nr:phosphotransferase [Candidatus Limnocylindria bacterium]
MRYVRERGYPAPEVVSVDGSDMVLERATGSTMRVDFAHRPWTLVRHARLLADLHRRLHRIAAPEWLPAIGPGGAVVHLDLHPENVLLHGNGALVIDWANARAGHWADDVAQTVVILAAADLGRATRLAIRVFLRIYLAGFDRDAVRAHLPAAIERRMADPNMTARERELIAALVSPPSSRGG